MGGPFGKCISPRALARGYACVARAASARDAIAHQVIAGVEPKESLRDVAAMLRNTSNPQASGLGVAVLGFSMRLITTCGLLRFLLYERALRLCIYPQVEYIVRNLQKWCKANGITIAT